MNVTLDFPDGQKIAEKYGGKVVVIEREFDLVNKTDKDQPFKFYKSSAIELNPLSGTIKSRGKIKVKLKYHLYTYDRFDRYGAIFLEGDKNPRIEMSLRWNPPFLTVENEEQTLALYSAKQKSYVDLKVPFDKLKSADVEIKTDQKWLSTQIVDKEGDAYLELTTSKEGSGPAAVHLHHLPTGYKEKVLFVYQASARAKLVPDVAIKNPVTNHLSKFSIVLKNFSGSSLKEMVKSNAGKVSVIQERRLGDEFVAECQIALTSTEKDVKISVEGFPTLNLQVKTLVPLKAKENTWIGKELYKAKDFARHLFQSQNAVGNQSVEFEVAKVPTPGISPRGKKGKGGPAAPSATRWNVLRFNYNDLIHTRQRISNSDPKPSTRIVIQGKQALYPKGEWVDEKRGLDRLVANPYFEPLQHPFFSNTYFELLADVRFEVSIDWQQVEFFVKDKKMNLRLSGAVTGKGDSRPTYTIEMILDPENYMALKSCEIRYVVGQKKISRTGVSETFDGLGGFGLPKKAMHQMFDANGNISSRQFSINKLDWPSEKEFWTEVKKIDRKNLIKRGQ